jgi:hypothetical protein
MFAALRDHISSYNSTVIPIFKFDGSWSVLINIPIIALFVFFWINIILQEKERIMKLFFLIPIFILLYHVPVFFLFFDFGRWMIMIVLIQFILLFYLIYMEDKTVLKVMGSMVPFINKNRVMIIYVCALMVFLGPVDAISPSARVMSIIRGLASFF